MLKLSLVFMNPGKTQGQSIPIRLAEFIIGRDPHCHLRPASPSISKQHAAVLVKNGQVSVKDFGSTNGTFVNETQVKGDAPLKNNDILKVGPLTFKVVIEKVVPTPPPAPARPSANGMSQDDSAAELLLAGMMSDDEEKPASPEDSAVPLGSTIMDLNGITLPPLTPPEPAKVEAEKKPEPAKPPEKKKVDAAHVSARAILEKYSRRTRG